MPTAATDITVQPLTTDRWDDLASLFREGGDPKWCWYNSQVGKQR